MADIRINALATTAASTASDDFIAVDGSANGTRKLNAYSPTFGGNLTVSGTATLGPTNPFKFDTNVMQSTASGFNGALVRSAVSTVGNPTFSNVDDTDTGIYFPAANTLAITTGGTQRLSVDATATTLSGNLTVSGTDYNYVGGNKFFRGFTNYNVLYTGATELSINNQADGANLASFKNSGNFLVGTTTDNGAKFQVEGYATFNRNGADGYLSVSRTSGATGTFGAGSTNSYLGTATNHPLVLYTNGTTALTLDSSQNATFAGDVGLSGNEKYLNLFSTYSVGSNSRARLRAVGSGGGSGYGGSFTVDTRTSGNTFITALTIDDAQNATFAGQITASGISHKLGSGGTGSANALLTIDGSSASNYGSYIVLQRNSTNKWQFGTYSGINGGTSDDFLLYNPTAANEALKIAAATSNATFAGSIAIGNTVNTVSPTSPNRTITMVIGGTTYYIHAKTTND